MCVPSGCPVRCCVYFPCRLWRCPSPRGGIVVRAVCGEREKERGAHRRGAHPFPGFEVATQREQNRTRQNRDYRDQSRRVCACIRQAVVRSYTTRHVHVTVHKRSVKSSVRSHPCDMSHVSAESLSNLRERACVLWRVCLSFDDARVSVPRVCPVLG